MYLDIIEENGEVLGLIKNLGKSTDPNKNLKRYETPVRFIERLRIMRTRGRS